MLRIGEESRRQLTNRFNRRSKCGEAELRPGNGQLQLQRRQKIGYKMELIRGINLLQVLPLRPDQKIQNNQLASSEQN